jgi:membrane protease YdiL (CAAX protease family)
LLPQLYNHHSLFSSALIIGVFWGVWHMNFNLGFIGYIAFLIFTITSSILMSFIYYKSNKNLIIMMIWHIIINLLCRIFLYNRMTAQSFIILDIGFAIAAVIIVVLNKGMFFKAKKN